MDSQLFIEGRILPERYASVVPFYFSWGRFLLLMVSSFSVVFLALFSASDIMLVHCLFFTVSVIFSACDGIFSSAAFHFFSTVSSSDTSSRASSGQESRQWGSPSQRSQAMATRVSGSRISPP